jgi:hypothetical protein
LSTAAGSVVCALAGVVYRDRDRDGVRQAEEPVVVALDHRVFTTTDRASDGRPKATGSRHVAVVHPARRTDRQRTGDALVVPTFDGPPRIRRRSTHRMPRRARRPRWCS